MTRLIGALQRQPSTLKMLYENRFSFIVHNLPEVSYTCQKANVPGIAVRAVTTSNPNTPIKHPGNQPIFDQLQIEFMVDQNLANWLEIYKWIYAHSFPRHTQTDRVEWQNDRVDVDKALNKQHSDGTLIVRNSQLNYICECVYRDLFPVSLSQLQFDTRTQNNDILVATAVFEYTLFEIRDVRPIE